MKEITYIYCTIEDGGHLVKIGAAKDPVKRARALQTANGRRMRLIAAFPGGFKEEAALRFAWGHLHLRGEWHVDEGGEISRYFEMRAAAIEAKKLKGTLSSAALAVRLPNGVKSNTDIGRPKQYMKNDRDAATWHNVTKHKTDKAAAGAIGVSVATLWRNYGRSGRAKTGRPRKSK